MKPKFTKAGLSRYFTKKDEQIQRIIIRELQVLGEKCVNICRTLDTYQDDTGNLRSSIYYVLYVGYKKYSDNFLQFPGKGSSAGEIGKNNAEAEAEKLAESIVSSYYSLIIGAGMEYAEEVEAKDFAVLTPGQLFAESEIPKLKQRVKNALKLAA